MASSGFAAFGIGITYDAVDVKELTNVTFGLGTADEIDISNHDSPDSTEEWVAGIIRCDTVDIEGNFVPTDTGQAALITALQARTKAELIITLVDSGNATFTGDAYVKSFRLTSPVTGKQGFTAQLKMAEKLTFAA